jgi:hypothetical protein
MKEMNGRLNIPSREGDKTLAYEEHPRGDGSLRIVTIDSPLNARELRSAAEMLEYCEKRLARDRARVGEPES